MIANILLTGIGRYEKHVQILRLLHSGREIEKAHDSTVHVRGLLFLDAGAYKLVAGRIVAP